MALFSEISVISISKLSFFLKNHLSVRLFALLTATSLVLGNIVSSVDEGSGLTGIPASPLPLGWQPESQHTSLSVASNWIQSDALTYWVPRALALASLSKLPSSPGSATWVHLIPWTCPKLPLSGSICQCCALCRNSPLHSPFPSCFLSILQASVEISPAQSPWSSLPQNPSHSLLRLHHPLSVTPRELPT